jgi:hypothetical protein
MIQNAESPVVSPREVRQEFNKPTGLAVHAGKRAMIVVNKLTTSLLLGMLMGSAARGQPNPCNSANHHCVVLTWTASPTWPIAGYNIFRGLEPGKENATPLNPLPVAASCGVHNVRMGPHRKRVRLSGPPCTWTDNNVQPNVTYYYYLVVVGSDGKMKSKASNEAWAKVPDNAR